MMDTCIQNLFQVSTLYKVGEGVGGEGELQDIIQKEPLFCEGSQK